MAAEGHRLDEGVIEVAARPPGSSGWKMGSGRLLPGGHVLTAAHLVLGPGTGETWVRSVVVGDRKWLKCRVVYRRYVPRERTAPGRDAVDLAVLHCTDPRLAKLPGLPPHRWGRLVTEPGRALVSATGFPRGSTVFDLDGNLAFRDTAQIDGVINTAPPGTGWREVRVSGPVPAPLDVTGDEATSRWKGMSGSGVLCNGLLVGVVVSAEPEPESGRLFVQDLAPLWDDPGMRGLLELPPEGPRSAELQPLLHPHTGHAMDSPVSLLRPEAGVVRFHGRCGELRGIADWRDGERHSAVRLITGPGGQGKTRLALAAVEEARRAGWAAGFLDDRADPEELRAFLSSRTVPLLLVLDYAEARTGQVRSLCETLHAEPGRPPARILLLARKGGEWWTTPAQYARTHGLLADGPDSLGLAVLEPSPRARTDAARLAARDLGERLRALRPGADPLAAPLPDVTDERFAGALNLQMTVLVAQLQHIDPVPAADGEPDEVILLLHEYRHWRRTAARFGLGSLPRKKLNLLVAAATLCGAEDQEEALATLGRLPQNDVGAADRTAAARWLADLYPSDGRYWGALQPDRLGEFLVGSVLAEERQLLEWLLPAADRRQIESAFHVLSRAAPHQDPVAERLRDVVTRHPGRLATPAVRMATEVAEPAPLREALDAVLEELEQRPRAGVSLARELYEAVPLPTLALDRWAADLAEFLVRLARSTPADDDTAATSELAGRLHRYAIRLGEIDRAAQALPVIREAIALRRELAAGGAPDAQAELALSLNTRTALLADTGHTQEALASAREVNEHYRRLSEHDPERHLPDLAMAETNLANQLLDAGSRLEAVAPARSALERYRNLAASDPAHAPDLALAHHNLAHALASAGRRAEAVEAAAEAVAAYHELARKVPDSHLLDLADALANLANQLQEAGRHHEAEEAMDEALVIHRKLADRSPARHLRNLAAALSDAVQVFRHCGDGTRAVSAAEESVGLLRPAAERQPLVHRFSLGAALVALGNAYADKNQPEDAVAALEEAVRLFRDGFRTLPEAYRPPLADALCNLGNYLGHAGRDTEAVRIVEKSITLFRELVQTEPEVHTPHLAIAVDVLANTLTDLGEEEKALPRYQEAYELLVPFAENEPGAHLEELTRVGTNWSCALISLDRWSDLLALTERTVGLLRTAPQDPAPYRAALAEVLTMHGIALRALDRPHDAVDPFRTAVWLSQQVFEERPGHLPFLLRALRRLADALSNVGRRREVAEVTSEALALHRHPAAAGLPPESRTKALITHTEALVEAGEHQGLKFAEEAVGACREPAPDSPEAERLLCTALSWYASALSREGLRQPAIEACEEALHRNRALAADVEGDPEAAAEASSYVASAAINLAWALVEAGPDRHAIELAEEALRLLGSGDEDDDAREAEVATAFEVIARAHTGLGQADRALGPALRSVDIHRRLVEEAPEVYAPALAQALGRHALALHAVGRSPEAAAAADEAVTLARGRFAEEPTAHAFDLASALIVQGRVQPASPAMGEAARIAARYGWHRLAEEARQA
ncbi:tetratricopeptide repeat protein [Streptomyces kebangsaanensis]|uniref:tetratricopeptide repeat protein n=1 Tax=Streptomyces kebangsaanensis TaxID=864058 RepID=UPI00093F9BDD|nr:tetratricopeptide repeat protein [Streptomyces kebangsaanensis]